MTRGDSMVVVVVALLALVALPMTVLASGGRSDVASITGPSGTSVVPLGPDRAIDVEGRSGIVRLEIEDGRVSVARSTCPDHLCMKQGEISSGGEALVCAPNGVSVRIGGEGEALDAVVR